VQLAKIYRPAKSAMQSGKGKTRLWVLEFEQGAALHPDVLMGWTSTTDTDGQVRLSFETREQAIEFARSRNIPHQVVEPRTPQPVIKSYSDNFAYRRREPWSH
jgi:hypothetical protein